MSYDVWSFKTPMAKKDCVVPWCDEEAYQLKGHPWKTHFCAEHFSTIDSHKVLIFPYSEQISIDISRESENRFLDSLSLLGLNLELIWIEPKTKLKYFVFEGGTLVGISSVIEYRPEYLKENDNA